MVRTAGIAAFLLLLASCTDDAPTRRTLDVFAAASLTDAFETMATNFEESHESVEVRLNLLSSSELVLQIEQGAPADVFASADEETMQDLVGHGLVATDAEIFATNEMTIVVAPGNPLDIRGVEDLAGDRLVVSLAAPGVPSGDYARAVLKNAGVRVEPDSLETHVRAVVTRVATGEADAGIVYESDAAATPAVARVEIPPSINVEPRYPIAVIDGADEDALAGEFVALVLSERGRSTMRAHGFESP